MCVQLFNVTVHKTIKNYFAIRLHVSAPIGHILEGNVQRNTCVILLWRMSVCEFKIQGNELKYCKNCVKCRGITGILHLFIIILFVYKRLSSYVTQGC